MLAGEARGRQILGRRGTADRNRDIGAVFLFELSIGRRDRFGQSRGAGRRIDDLAGCSGGFGQQLHLALVETVKQAVELLQGLRAGEGIAISLRRQGEAVRHLDVAFRQGAIELAQRCRLAAHGRNIAEPNIAEPADAGVHLRALFRFSLHCNRPPAEAAPFWMFRKIAKQYT